MAIIKKFSPFQNLSSFQVFLNDTQRTSQYFKITEFKDTLTGGKNGFLIEGSEFLKESTEIKIEVLDVEGNPVYFEPGEGIPEYYEGISKLVSVHVYDDTPIGTGKITILGELKNYVDDTGAIVPVPDEWKGIYNLKWERTFNINKNLSNEDIVRFYKRPEVTITELVKPIFSKTVPTVTKTGYVHGISEVPNDGTDIRTWRAGTLYKLQLTSGSWDKDVDENTITISSPSHTAKIIEVLNDSEVLIDVPYTSNNFVSNFTSGSYSVTYSDFQNEIIGETTLTGSFAKINITQLKTFVGDVARVKVFRKSRNAVGDFQFVQESKLESSELLRDITTTSDTELSYGRFDETNLSTYWETSSVQHPVTIDSSVLSQAVKFDYNTTAGGVQQLITSESISISKDVEYTLNFRTILSGSLSDTGKSIRAFFSSSNFTQNFLTISGSAIYRTRQNVSKNILSENTGNAKLVFEVKGDDWYISNASLKNAQETSFSPDEFLLIQDIPRKTASETFDFIFEFYDINNNFIPVIVTAVGVFDGGNDFPTSGKLLTFESDRNAFRFTTGSIANPYNQTIKFSLTRNNLTGSVTYASSAFDVDGNYLDPSDYNQYPGKLTNVTTAGGLVTLSNFTGSRTDGLQTPYVGSIVYTASLENLQEFETVYRLEDGDNAPQLIVTSNANQFTYEPTALEPKPSGQTILVRAQRKNLASLVTPIEVNSGSNKPELTYVGTEGGIDTYSISATQFSSSFSDNSFDEVTYSFTGSDVFGNNQSDEITLSKVVNFDGVSITLSNESTSFRSNGQGVILDDVSSGDGVVEVRIANKEIAHSNGLSSPNRFDIISATATNVTEAYSSYLTNEYGISAMSQDSGSLLLNIKYLAGDNSTSQSFQKKVNYTKNRIASPSLTFDTTNKTQNVDAKSTGVQLTSFDDSTITIREFYTGSVTTFSSGNVSLSITSGSNDSSGNPLVTRSGLTLSFGNLPNGTNSTQVGLTATVTDSEGESRTTQDTISLSKTNASAPNVEFQVTPVSQTIQADAAGSGSQTPGNLTVTANEGGSSRTLSALSATATSGVTITSSTASTGIIVIGSDATDMTSDTGTITISASTTNTEGTTVTKSLQATVARVRDSAPVVSVAATPIAQTLASDSQGNGTQSPTTITVTALEGDTDVFDSMTVSYSGGISGTVSTNTITFTDTASDMTSDTETVTITVTYTDTAGTTATQDIVCSITRVKNSAPVIVAALDPQVQTVDSNSDFSTVTAPSAITLTVNEGGTGNYGYDSSGAVGTEKFRVTGVTGGTFNSSTGVITPTTPSSATGTSGTVTFSYTNSEGTAFTGKTIDFSVGVAVQGGDGDPGASGPGVVFRGPWNSSTTYYDTDDFETRRDAVLYDGVYYATKTNSTTNLNKQPDTQTSFWEELGTGDFFVAAKISIFEESYIQNTLNIGTDTTGNAHITLTGINDYPYFSLGQSSQGYGSNGIFIGNDGSNGQKLSLVNGTTGYLKWTGTGLEIKGDITITGGSGIDNFSDAGAFATLDTATLSLISDAGNMAGIDQITTGNASTYIGSNAIVSGLIAANTIVAGNIAANTITTSELSTDAIKSTNYDGPDGSEIFSDAGSFFDLSNGDLITPNLKIDSTGLTLQGTVSGSSVIGGTIGGAQINVPTTSPKFTVGSTGAMTATDADITGTVTATSGEIGGWKVGTSQFYSPTSGAKRMEINAGSSPNISINDSNGVANVVINSGTTLSNLDAGSASPNNSITSMTSYTKYYSAGQNNVGTITSVFTEAYLRGPSSSNMSINSLSEGLFTVTCTFTVPGGLSNATAKTVIENSDIGGADEPDEFYSRVYLGMCLSTSAASPTSLSSWNNQPFKLTKLLQHTDLNPSTETFYLPYDHDLNDYTATVQGSFNNTANNQTYYVHTALLDYRTEIEHDFYLLDVTTTFKTPRIANSSLTLSAPVDRTEICGGGLQVVSSTDNYVKMERNTSGLSANSVMLDVGGSIEATGNVTANASDIRLKNILGLIENPLDKLKELKGVRFTWNQIANELAAHKMDEEHIGLIAQDVQKVLPQVVKKSPIGKNDDNHNYLTIWYEKLVPLLVESIKELSKKVERLEEQNKRLEDGN